MSSILSLVLVANSAPGVRLFFRVRVGKCIPLGGRTIKITCSFPCFSSEIACVGNGGNAQWRDKRNVPPPNPPHKRLQNFSSAPRTLSKLACGEISIIFGSQKSRYLKFLPLFGKLSGSRPEKCQGPGAGQPVVNQCPRHWPTW